MIDIIFLEKERGIKQTGYDEKAGDAFMKGGARALWIRDGPEDHKMRDVCIQTRYGGNDDHKELY
ncbi:MAG TPA: hypothetical protein PLF76_05025, partial [Methanomassiliicoccaceae archaeon]|nr:hypothetical protein [Methanomassiliicoccaceae archaeon]